MLAIENISLQFHCRRTVGFKMVKTLKIFIDISFSPSIDSQYHYELRVQCPIESGKC